MCSILEKQRMARNKNRLMPVEAHTALMSLQKYDRDIFGDDE